MPQPQAAAFELGLRAVVGLVGIAVGVGRSIGQQRVGAQHFNDLLGIGLPIGSAVDVATCSKALRQCMHQRRLNQTALVVAGFVPGVGEENMHAVQTASGQHVSNYFYRIMRTNADIA